MYIGSFSSIHSNQLQLTICEHAKGGEESDCLNHVFAVGHLSLLKQPIQNISLLRANNWKIFPSHFPSIQLELFSSWAGNNYKCFLWHSFDLLWCFHAASVALWGTQHKHPQVVGLKMDNTFRWTTQWKGQIWMSIKRQIFTTLKSLGQAFSFPKDQWRGQNKS